MTANNKTMRAAKAKVKAATAGPAATTAKPVAGIRADLRRMREQIALALPKMVEPDRFYRIVESAISANPKLEECTPRSFLGAVMQAAQLGLEPNTPLGQAYLIPYRNRGVMECQFQLGYNGIISLAYRSGQIAKIDAQTVYENDYFEYELGWDARLVHRPAMSDRGAPIGFYALFKTRDGGGNFLFMSLEDVQRHAKRFSKTFNKKTGEFSGPWATDFEAMAKKTTVKQLLKYAPIDVEFARQVSADGTVKSLPQELGMDMTELPNEVEADFVIEEPESPERHVSEESQTQTGPAALAGELGGDPFPLEQSLGV